MPPTIDSLVNGWAAHFQSADADIRWLRSEVEAHLWLTPNTLLMGRVDAFGLDANGGLFFGEWKTSSPRDRKTWKQTWRLNPQSLTYGVLATTIYPDCSRFMVRKAFKSDPPSYDHAWYAYTSAELDMWRTELIRIADEIRGYGQSTRWPLNLSACHQFGAAYVCPFFEPACSKLDWAGKPADALVRISHLDLERELMSAASAPTPPRERLNGGCPGEKEGPPADIVVLDATRVKTWLSCRERFRREYIDNVATPRVEGSALDIGIAFHELLARYYQEKV
jgi:PD-(D/E)XK nuclease superfamily